jgi:hypothetical protein
MLPNLNILEEISSVSNYDPLVPGRYERWMEEIEDIDHELKSELLNLMGVSVIGTRSLTEDNGVWFNELGTAKRIRWVPCAMFTRDEEAALNSILTKKIDFDSTIILEGSDPDQENNCSQFSVAPNIISENPNQVTVQVDAIASGWLVLSDVWYPGWKATIDEIEAPVLRANYLFRAVPVDIGQHEIIFNYRPTSFYLGAVLSLISCLSLIWFSVSTHRNS